ncbi:cfem domain-containing protein [Neofusicoccum parvum]|uniref:Cfem domain-containing protein n=2 Tax=Neofusicoccum parvum TaxID=310453 RepID=A0ACB5S2X5_9PEZI|nr:putative cfem domain-containing protein [Neofusicoccum parvum UCRNP2]GME27111.1 cfem domain-containing protein [Neofusicoccum parvum]GME38433.1 cfem domain-containing protein [Neofusicoccum parvum]
MPSCGLLCLEKNIAASPCALTDTECSCSNATLTAQVEACVLTSCKVKEQLCMTKAVSVSGIVGGIFALIAYVLRMVSRLPHFGGTLGWDDAAMTFVVVLVAPLTCLSVVLANLGLGKDIWTIPFDNITHILYVSIPGRTLPDRLAHETQIYYFDEDLYLSALPLLKISILLFYLRIFPEKGFRKMVFVTMGLCAGYAIAFVLVSVFQCKPIKYAWLQWDDEHEGTCNNINAQGWSSAALNVILDMIVIILPLPQLWQLQLNKRKKFLLLLMFSVGFFVTIVSILRLQVLIEFGSTHNLTWDYTAVGYWSTIEIHVGIICACMPAMRSLLMHCIPKVMGQTTRDKSYGATSSALSHGLSSSNNPKGSQLSNRAKGDDDGDFIPLVDVESQAGTSIGGAHSLPPTRAGYQET